MVGAERPGVAFLTCGLDCKLTIKNSIQRQHTAVTVARCNSTQRATSASSCSSCCIRSKVWQAYSDKQNSCVKPCILQLKVLSRLRNVEVVDGLAKSNHRSNSTSPRGFGGQAPKNKGKKENLKNKKINFTNKDRRSKGELVKLQIKGMPTYTSQIEADKTRFYLTSINL